MIRIDLTRKQMKQLRKHFDVVNECARMGERGVLAAQVHEDWNGLTGYVRVHFIPSNKVDQILKAVGDARVPNGRAAIPAPQHSGAQKI